MGKIQQENLTTREWKVYNFIKKRSEQKYWTHIEDIYDFLLSENMEATPRTIRKVINKIRKDSVIQKIIITDYKKGYRLMTDEEEITYLENRKISILKMLKQYWKDIARFNKNNQSRIAFTKDERDFIESILKQNTK